jgi:hypothetical protein
LSRFFEGIPAVDFLEGMFGGISMVMNLTFLYKLGREHRLRDNDAKVQNANNWIRN